MNSFFPRLAVGLGAIRYAAILGVLSSAVGAVLMFVVGAGKTWEGIKALLTGVEPTRADPGLDLSAAVTTELFSALDSFLFGVVLLYAAYGMFALFVAGDTKEVTQRLPRHLVPGSLSELKHQVAMVVVVLLFVLFLELAWSSLDGLHNTTWELLVVPVSVLLLSVSLWFLTRCRAR